jgi:nucleoside-diphosphate-sugar epimerase
MKDMNILITGGAGYIGSAMVDELLTGGAWKVFNRQQMCSFVPDPDIEYDPPNVNVTVIDNLMYKQDGLIPFCRHHDRFTFINGDVRDQELLDKWCDWADVIIPLAALVGFPACERDKLYATQVNEQQIVNIATKYGKKKKVLYPNSNSGYGVGLGDLHCTEETSLTPISTYGKTKCAAERVVLDNGGVAFRLATVFGVSPRMRLDLLVNDFTYKAVTDGYIVLFEKDFKRNFIHVRDVVNAFFFMVRNYDKHQGQVFNLGLSDANLSKWELCQKIKKYVPNFSIQVDEIRKDPDQRNYIVSNEKIEKAGWKPKVSLDDGIKELLQAYKIITSVNKRYSNA